jgi:hypothetical protein
MIFTTSELFWLRLLIINKVSCHIYPHHLYQPAHFSRFQRSATPPSRAHARRLGRARLGHPRLRCPALLLLLLPTQAEKHRRQRPRLSPDGIGSCLPYLPSVDIL